ncbi:MAG: hypothetical protein MUF49_29305 [Oculatellaceae cyanobacterium Prado106]|nr:hypothetical protein [Oculatellaceae cyanobacterium Prado106]
MSEVTISPPSGTVSGPGYSLEIISDRPVRVDLPDFLGQPLVIEGTDADDTVIVDPSTTTSVIFEGGDGFDFYDAGVGNDFLFGGDNDDFLASGGGDDRLFGEEGDDVLYGEAGNDRLRGAEGDDTLVGGSGNDQLFGATGNDWLLGGPGNDLLDPGAGVDQMIGGAGADTFRFRDGSTGGRLNRLDRIRDFKPNQDSIELSRGLLPGSGLNVGQLSASDFQVVQNVGNGGNAKLIYERTTGILYYNPDQGDNVPLLRLPAELSGISATNFTIF